MGVVIAQRSKRIGEKLMAACMGLIEIKRVATLYLTLHPDNAAGITIYTRLGFEVQEEMPDYFLDNRPRLLMRKQIQR